jgi:hypothetical protein
VALAADHDEVALAAVRGRSLGGTGLPVLFGSVLAVENRRVELAMEDGKCRVARHAASSHRK